MSGVTDSHPVYIKPTRSVYSRAYRQNRNVAVDFCGCCGDPLTEYLFGATLRDYNVSDLLADWETILSLVELK